MSRKQYLYTLVPYSGRKSREVCQGCERPRCYTRFVNVSTGELLHERYGRCDHEVSCGYFLSPYHIEADGTSYAERMSGKKRLNDSLVPGPSISHYVRPAPAKVVYIPQSIYQQSMRHYEQNAFARLLRRYFGCDSEQELLRKFHVGTSRYWPSACVFWLIDERGRICNGQVVQFDDNGHTVKTSSGRRTRWMHLAMTRRLQNAGKALPEWLVECNSQSGSCSHLYGLFQLATAPNSYPIALVESPKAAIIASLYYPCFIWMATMGLGNLTAERLEPLRGHPIVLWPDVGGYDKWQAKATALNKLGFTIEVSDFLEKRAANENGLDLADVLLRGWKGYPPNWDVREE